jgi:WD40 repeat protein
MKLMSPRPYSLRCLSLQTACCRGWSRTRNQASSPCSRYHDSSIEAVAFHRSYPLFASCSDDGSAHVFHGMVYSNLLENPLIVPVKILRGHKVVESEGENEVLFCRSQSSWFGCDRMGLEGVYLLAFGRHPLCSFGHGGARVLLFQKQCVSPCFGL